MRVNEREMTATVRTLGPNRPNSLREAIVRASLCYTIFATSFAVPTVSTCKILYTTLTRHRFCQQNLQYTGSVVQQNLHHRFGINRFGQ